ITPGGYLLGVLLLSLVTAAVGLGAWWLRSGLLAGWYGAPARMAEVIIGLGVVVGVEEALGSVGLFRRGAVVAACLVAGLTTAVVGRHLTVVHRACSEAQEQLVGVVDTTPPLAGALAVAAVGSVSVEWWSRVLTVV